MQLAPIVLFTYNRPQHTRQTLEALTKNVLADQSDLFIYCDGPKKNATSEQLDTIKKTREVIREKKWCKTVTIYESDINKGLADSIISGVTEIINKFGKIIVLEDDIVTGKYFLDFMNTTLEKYKNNNEVWHITGWRDPIKKSKNDSSFFYPTMDCWSWGTWQNRWIFFKKDIPFYEKIFTQKMIHDFNIDGTNSGMWQQILLNKEKKINTWAIFWYATIFIKDGLCLAPTQSLIRNIGFDNSGVHCGENKLQEIKNSIDNKIINYPQNIMINYKEYLKNKKFNQKLNTSCKFNIKKIIKQKFPNLYLYLKKIFYKVLKRPPKILGTVYMLHRVAEREIDKLFSNENMKISPTYLNMQIQKIQQTHTIISSIKIKQYIKQKHKKPFAVFTLDDGYKDNYTNAFPVFKKNNCPFTIFLTTNFPDKTAILWWYLLEDLILQNDCLTLSNGKTYSCTTQQEKENTFLKIRGVILNLNQEVLEQELNQLFNNYSIDWKSKCDELCMSWDDIKILQTDSLVTFGAHTKNHFNLKALPTKDAVIKEIQDGLDILKNHGINATTFAYPFGSPNEVSDREVKILKSMSFSTAFLAYGGNFIIKHKNHFFEIPRIMMTEEETK